MAENEPNTSHHAGMLKTVTAAFVTIVVFIGLALLWFKDSPTPILETTSPSSTTAPLPSLSYNDESQEQNNNSQVEPTSFTTLPTTSTPASDLETVVHTNDRQISSAVTRLNVFFTSIDQKGQLLGVAIAPGVRTAMQSLSSNTAKLPEIPLEIPAQVIGTDTVSALQAGIMQGYVGLVKHMIEETKKEMKSKPKVIATGGLSFIFKPLHDIFDALDVNLTLQGLLSILNQSKS